MNLPPLSLILVFLLLSAACGNGNGDPAETQGADAVFQDIRWTVSSVHGETPADDPGLREEPWIRFSTEDGSFHGNGGCNNYFGGYSIEDGRLASGNVASTQMACTEPVMDFEFAYLQALSQVVAWKVEDGKLFLQDENGELTVTFQKHQE